MNKSNFAFFGTQDVASETLQILKENGYLPSLIITSPDKPQGRKMLITPPPVKVWAEKNKIPYIQPENQAELLPYVRHRGNSPMSDIGEGKNFDLFIIVAYGKILPEEILNIPKYGSINIHYSLLPKYRGASPVESAILNGDTETGITIQKMTYKMDSGPIIATEKTAIPPDEKAPELRTRLIKIGGELLIKILPDLADEKIKEVPQDESKATYCAKIKKEDGLLDLDDDAVKNYNKFRAYAHWPRTFFFSAKGGSASGGKDGKRIIVTDAALQDGKFVIKKVIPESGKEIDYKNFG